MLCSKKCEIWRRKLFGISAIKLIYLYIFSIFIIIQIADNQKRPTNVPKP